MKLRTSDPTYVAEVDRWFNLLFPKLVKHLYKNGGTIITVQIENEYGCHPDCDKPICDTNYTSHLRDLTKKILGDDVVLFTTDPVLKCERIQGTLATVDFGVEGDPGTIFSILRKYMPKGPLVNSEFYPGWVDMWEIPHQTRKTESFCNILDKILSFNASVNM